MAVRRTATGWLFALTALSTAPGCGDSATSPTTQTDEALLLSVTSATLTPGQSLKIEASAAGAVVWESSDPQVVAVSAAGVVEARKTGFAEVTARSRGKKGKTKVKVEEPVTIPASTPTPTPTAPAGTAGTTLAFEDGFETGAPSANQNGYGWVGYSPSAVQGVSVSRAVARTGAHSMKFTFAGTSDTCEDAMAEQRFTMGENLPEAWFEYYVYLPKGNEGVGPKFVHRKPVCDRAEWPDPNGIVTNNKFFVVWADNYSTEGNVQVTVEYQRQTDTTSNIRVTGMKGDSRGMEATGTKHTSSLLDPSTRGRWVRVRVHVKTASAPGAYDGMVEVWRDDTLVYSLYNFDVVYAGGKNFFRNGYLMGWANSGFDQNTSVYVDDFKIFRSRPAW